MKHPVFDIFPDIDWLKYILSDVTFDFGRVRSECNLKRTEKMKEERIRYYKFCFPLLAQCNSQKMFKMFFFVYQVYKTSFTYSYVVYSFNQIITVQCPLMVVKKLLNQSYFITLYKIRIIYI